MPEYKDVSLIIKEIEEGKKNLHFKSAENAEICAGVLAFVEGVIDRVPEADVELVKHGKWLNYYGNYETAECSVCEELYEVSDTVVEPHISPMGYHSRYYYHRECLVNEAIAAILRGEKFNNSEKNILAVAKNKGYTKAELLEIMKERGINYGRTTVD